MNAILVIYIWAGVMAKGDSVAINNIPLPTLEICEREGKRLNKLVQNTTKDVTYICLKTN